MDAKYLDNSYKMPIVSMCKLNPEGYVEILLKAFVSNEKTESF